MSLLHILEPEVMDSDEEARNYDAMDVAATGLSSSISLELRDAKALPYTAGSFRGTVSNTILHHIPDPLPAIREMQRVVDQGGILFLRDQIRPQTDEAVQVLVAQYASNATLQQRALFEASLRASFTLDEVREFAEAGSVPASAIQQTSDRHWTLAHVGRSEQA